MFDFGLFAISILVVGWGVIFFCLTKGITFFGTNTDNQKQVYAASQSSKWRWPSDMHKYGRHKTYMKDVSVLLLAVVQCIMRDKNSDRPLVILAASANLVSAVLIYLISEGYWGQESALVISILYMMSIWPWQIALMGGHICIAQPFFLLSLFCIQRADSAIFYNSVLWFLAAGFSFGWSQFSSASARKFTPLFIGAFFYAQYNQFAAFSVSALGFGGYIKDLFPDLLWVLVISFFLFIVVSFGYKSIVSSIYFSNAPSWLNRIIKSRDKNSIDHYLKKAKKLLGVMKNIWIVSFLYIFFYLFLFGKSSFYRAQLPIFMGVGVAFLILLLPDILSNARRYFSYFGMAKSCGHFRHYEEYFRKIGHPIKKDMRGAGVEWLIKYFGLICPFQLWIYILSVTFLIGLSLSGHLDKNGIWEVGSLIFLSLSPVLFGEITRAPQIGRTYFPGFFGLLMLIAYAYAQIQNAVFSEAVKMIFGFSLWIIVIVSVMWNCRLFFRDVFPARMAIAWLTKTLRRRGIKKFYTYNISFNDTFVNAIYPENMKEFEICYIENIQEVIGEDGVIVVPPTSSKSVLMESQREGYTNKDFTSDVLLNKLIDSKKILDCSVASFKTFGTSKIWTHESEATTYRDLILKEITEKDRWRGYGWILSLSKIRDVLI